MYLEINKDEAIYLRRVVHNDWVKDGQLLRYGLVLRLCHAILELEREDLTLKSYPLEVSETDLWALDDVVKEESKTMTGKPLIPLLRQIWRQLCLCSAEELVSLPDIAVASEYQDRSKGEVDAHNNSA